MGARTGADYLKGLRSTHRELWLGSEKVDDVADHPQLRAAAEVIASALTTLVSGPASTTSVGGPVFIGAWLNGCVCVGSTTPRAGNCNGSCAGAANPTGRS